MKGLLVSCLLFISTSASAAVLTSAKYNCTMANALGVALLSYSESPESSDRYKAVLTYGFLKTTFRGGALTFASGASGGGSAPGSAMALTTGRLNSDSTQLPYAIFLQAASPSLEEQTLSGVIGFVPVLGLMPNPYMMSPFYLPMSTLGFVVPVTGFVPTAALSCRVNFQRN